MSKFYVGSEVGQLRRVMLHRPNLSLKRLTPSNCQDLLFDDVLSVERAGQEHDKFAQVLRDQNVEVFLLTNLLAETLDVPEAKAWLLQHRSPIIASAPHWPMTCAASWLTCRTASWPASSPVA